MTAQSAAPQAQPKEAEASFACCSGGVWGRAPLKKETDMTKREHFKNILNHKSDRPALWHGCPHGGSRPALYQHYGAADDFDLGLKIGSCFNWCGVFDFYKHPEGYDMFDVLGGKARQSLGQDGVFADCEDPGEIESFNWPDVKYCDFTSSEAYVERTIESGQAVLSGTWACFFHNVCDFFGMENYFVKMHTDPEVVEAVTERVVDFYLQANEKWFDVIGDRMDAIFFGNDFGSQLDLLISPEMFKKFVLPHFIKITQAAKKRGYKVVLHSCGAIERVIPWLIEAGVDALHPIQAKARDMDAQTLAKKYRDKLVFIGGVDTQELLPFGTPQQVKDEVRRLKDLFGPNFIVSPSHEAILENIPPANIEAMAEAALEG